MNQFEKSLQQAFGIKAFNKIQSLTVGIGGARGVGSNCAFNRVRCGFKNCGRIDYDKIEYSNTIEINDNCSCGEAVKI